MVRTYDIRRFICTLCGVFIASLGLIGCGATSDPVARVDDHAITKATLERWTAIEAVLAYETDPTRPVPKGVVPDPPTYINCIAYLKAPRGLGLGHPDQTAAQLKKQCGERRRMLQRHVLDILLVYYWLRGEAAEKGVKLTRAKIRAGLDRAFPNPAAYRRHLSLTGKTPADERMILEKNLLDTKLLDLVKADFGRRQVTSQQQREQAFIGAARAFTKKWMARTTCSTGYIVPECKEYKGPISLIEP